VFNVTLSFEGLGSVPGGGVSEALTGYVFPAEGGVNAIQPESTLLRIRGSIELGKNAVSDTGSLVVITTRAFGIGVMETTAALKSAFPNPASPEGANWDGWMFYRSIAQGAVDANGGIVDVKAMRKIESGYSLVMAMGVYSTQSDTANPPIIKTTGFFTARGLFLLP